MSTFIYGVPPNFDELLDGTPVKAIDPQPPMTMDQFFVEFYSQDEKSEVEAILSERLHKHLQSSRLVNDLKRNCNTCFEKLSSTKRDKVLMQLKREEFYEAFKNLNQHFVRLGAGNVKAFEDEVLSYRLQPGQDFSSHLDMSTQAMKR